VQACPPQENESYAKNRKEDAKGRKEDKMKIDWRKEFGGAITVCDCEGIILEMNEKAIAMFAKDGGAALIGQNLLDCHPEPTRTKLAAMMREGKTNAFTLEKNGAKKLIYQTPWFEGGEQKGFMEIDIELPAEVPNFVRD